jgi:GntR family transcriptional regulator
MFRRLWTANDIPVCIETSHLPLALVPDLAAQDLMGAILLQHSAQSLWNRRDARGSRDRRDDLQ